jgi:hypothetical protein
MPPDEDRIILKLEQIDGKVDELLLWKSALDVRCEAHREKTDRMEETLYGNPGMESQVAKLSNFANNAKFRKKWLMSILAIVIATLATATILWLAGKIII